MRRLHRSTVVILHLSQLNNVEGFTTHTTCNTCTHACTHACMHTQMSMGLCCLSDRTFTGLVLLEGLLVVEWQTSITTLTLSVTPTHTLVPPRHVALLTPNVLLTTQTLGHYLHILHCEMLLQSNITGTKSEHFYCKNMLTRFPSKTKHPDGKWSRKPLAFRESKNVSSMCNLPFRVICQFCF